MLVQFSQLFSCFSDVNVIFPLFHELFTKHQNQNSSILGIKLNLFLSPCKKLRLFETMCSMLPIRKFSHFLPVYLPFLELFRVLRWVRVILLGFSGVRGIQVNIYVTARRQSY